MIFVLACAAGSSVRSTKIVLETSATCSLLGDQGRFKVDHPPGVVGISYRDLATESQLSCRGRQRYRRLGIRGREPGNGASPRAVHPVPLGLRRFLQ
jgi:hypothetical protein